MTANTITTGRAGVGGSTVAVGPGWLSGFAFDRHFIVTTAAIAILSGVLVSARPGLFLPVLLLDLWLLGYHHVVSTYTRLCFDRAAFRKYHVLVVAGLPATFAVVAFVGASAGIAALATIYLYWQWFHYTRQSWGIAQAYRRAAGGIADNPHLAKAAFYLVPLWGILHRAHQAPDEFLGLPVMHPPVPGIAVDIVGILAVAALGWWAVTRVYLWRQNRLPAGHTLYMLSHFAVFYTGYIAIENIDAGWIALNIWHNAQYIAFVWLQNNKRFADGVKEAGEPARFLSWLSQRRNLWAYMGVCLAISTAVYAGIQWSVAGMAALMIVYQTINFHHYIVDAIIWRRPKSAKTAG